MLNTDSIIKFLKTAQLNSLAIDNHYSNIITEFGNPEDKSKQEKDIYIYSYFNNILQVTCYNDLVKIIAFEIYKIKELPNNIENELKFILYFFIENYQFKKLITFFKKNKVKYFLNKNLSIDESKLIHIGQSILISFYDEEIDSIQISNSF